MLLSLFLALCALFSVAASDDFSCGTLPTAARVAEIDADVAHLNRTENDRLNGLPPTQLYWFEVLVWWHVIQAGPTKDQGFVSKLQINKQLSVMNDAYHSAGIKFILAGVDYTTNSKWFLSAYPEGDLANAMKRSLHKGDLRTLNIYSVGFVNLPESLYGLAGQATFLQDVRNKVWDDGVMLKNTVVTMGSMTNYDLGHTAIHETGHWFGLYHTFQNGCNPPGDGIFDTPAEAVEALGCPTGRDSCPGSPGLDPIHNYMDYTYDWCKFQFSYQQTLRMRVVAGGRGIKRSRG